MTCTYEYDVVLSFAGEDREIVEKIAILLKDNGLRVFYDRFETPQLLGKNLYDHFSQLFDSQARFCVIVISKHYPNKPWARVERHAAQERAFREQEEYILPVRIDDTTLPGLGRTVGYVDLRNTSIEEVAQIIISRVRAPNAYLRRMCERWRANGYSLDWVLPEPELTHLAQLQPSYAPDDQFAGFAIASFIRHGRLVEMIAWLRGHVESAFIADTLARYATSKMRRVRFRSAALLSVMLRETREKGTRQLMALGDPFGLACSVGSGDFALQLVADESLSPILRDQISTEVSTIRRSLPGP